MLLDVAVEMPQPGVTATFLLEKSLVPTVR